MLDTLSIESMAEALPSAPENIGTKVQILKGKLTAARKFAADATETFESKRAALEVEIQILTAEWERENKLIVAEKERAEKWAGDCDKQLRNALVENYELTGEKTFDKQLSVRVSEKLKYDEQDAISWAETNAPVLIRKAIDKKAFEVFTLTQDLEFVESEKTVTAVIAKDLSV